MVLTHIISGRKVRVASLALTILTIILMYSFGLADRVSAGQVTVAWDPDTGSAVAGYRVYWGTASGNYSLYADAGSQTTYTIPTLNSGATYYIAATAYDAARNESGYSNEVTYTMPSACTYATTPASQSFGAGGGTGTVMVTAGPTCSWTTSNPPSWISIVSGASGTGSGSINYKVAANTDVGSRTAGMSVAGMVITVTQAGAQSTYLLDISESGTGSGTVTTNPAGTTFNAGRSVTLAATPAAGSRFTGWSGACSGAAATCTVVMNGDLSVTANFQLSKVSPGQAKKNH